MKAITLLLLMIGLLLLSACADDPVGPCGGAPCPPELPERADLSQRWHVLNNIEYAYRTREPEVYDELLNADFTFFFSPGDIGSGTPESWSRVEELDATTRWFLSDQQSQPPHDPVCRVMRLNLDFDKNRLEWIAIQPNAFPAETWYTTTVDYTFSFEMEPDVNYIGHAETQFTVRNIASESDPHWELVEFRELGSNVLERHAARSNEAMCRTCAPTWGRIKALYQ